MLVNLVLRGMSSVGWEDRVPLLGTTKESTEVFVEMGQKQTDGVSRGKVDGIGMHTIVLNSCH